MSKWYYELPHGPLTREDHSRLAAAYYDTTDPEHRRIAEQRGIKSGELAGVRIAALLAKANSGKTGTKIEGNQGKSKEGNNG